MMPSSAFSSSSSSALPPSSSSSSFRRSLSFRRSDGCAVDGEEILRTLRREGSSVSEILCEEIEFGDDDVAEMEKLLIEFHRAIHLTNLELSSNGLTPAAGRPLASILKVQYETIERLNLSKNPLQSVGLNELIEPLTLRTPSSRLVHLDLAATQLGPKSAPMLASLLRNNRSIQTLLLSNNQLGTRSIKVFAPELTSNPILQTLDLSYNNIKHKGASILAKALEPSPTLTSTLQVLDISGNKIGPQGMRALCEVLVENKTIQELRCGANHVGEEGAASISSVLKFNYTLRILDLQSNEIGPCGASLLMDVLRIDNRTLESLNLAWNGVGSLIAEELAEVLTTNEILVDVNVKGNEIMSDGVSSLANSLASNVSLEKLNLMHNKFDKFGAFALADAVGKPSCPLQPQNLFWDDNPAIGEEGAASLERIPQLRHNRQSWFGQLLRDIDQGLVPSIDLRHRNIGDEEILQLADALAPKTDHGKQKALPLVRSMWLSGPSLRPRSLVPLFESCIPSPANVVRLYLKDCVHLGEESIEAISICLNRSTSLQVLCLHGCRVTPHGAGRLAQGLKRNASLRRLNLDCNRISDKGLLELASTLPHPTLQALSANENDITDAAMGAEGLTQIQELHLKNNHITNKGAFSLANILDGNSCRLTWISLQGNDISKKGGEMIKLFLPETIPGGSIVDY